MTPSKRSRWSGHSSTMTRATEPIHHSRTFWKKRLMSWNWALIVEQSFREFRLWDILPISKLKRIRLMYPNLVGAVNPGLRRIGPHGRRTRMFSVQGPRFYESGLWEAEGDHLVSLPTWWSLQILTCFSHFGPLHKHGWMPHPKNGPEEFVIVYDSKE